MAVVSTQQSTVIAKPISGDYRIDVLLDDAATRWNHASPVGTPVVVTYSFMAAPPSYADQDQQIGFVAFTAEQRSAVREILSLVSQQVGISFREVYDSEFGYGQIRFGNNYQGAESAGYAFLPDTSIGEYAGDVYISNDWSSLHNVVPGTYAYMTLVHEIGHALGLKHPGNYNAYDGPSNQPGNYLAASEDTDANTVMSYIDVPQEQQRVFLGKYDVLALQYLYGARPYATGDNLYRYGNDSGLDQILINDNGGSDTIDASGTTVGATIDLRDGSFSSIGIAYDGSVAAKNISIAYGCVIENAIGTARDDQFTGNAANNTFSPGRGNDTIVGGQGFDCVKLSATRSNFTISRSGAIITAADNTAAFGIKTMSDVERIKFADKVVAFDTDGVAGQAYRLYQAAFNRKPDESGLGYQVNALETGVSVTQLAQNFINSPEFTKTYGSLNDAQFVTQLYENVLHRAPDADGLGFHVANLGKGVTRATTLVGFSESPENQAALIGVMQNGMEFVPVV